MIMLVNIIMMILMICIWVSDICDVIMIDMIVLIDLNIDVHVILLMYL